MQNFSDFIERVKEVEVANMHLKEMDDGEISGSNIPITKLSILTGDSALGDQTVALKSSVGVQTCNPYWYIPHMQWEEEGYLEKRGGDQHVSLVITSEGRPCHVKIEFEVKSLIFLGRLDVKQIFLPLNSLFLHDDDGMWVTKESVQTIPHFEQNIVDVSKICEIKGAYGEDETDNRGDATSGKEGIEKVRALFVKRKEALKGADGVNVLLEMEIEEWKKKAEAMELEADREEEMMRREATALAEISDVQEAMRLLGKSTSILRDLEKQIKEIIDKGIRTKFLLEARQLKLVGELQTIYPIELVRSTGRYAIKGLELPAFDCPARDEEQLTTALGYLVHLLLLLSKYLDVPLRYQPLYFSSRSLIKDAVTGVSMPLYRKDIETEKFKKAILWLQRDIEQLLDKRSLIFDEKQNILAETQKLFMDLMEP